MASSLRNLVLRDGRKLGFREYGRVGTGYPVIFTHGNLNSRLFCPSWTKTETDAETAGAWVVAVDRPGYGESSIHEGRQYRDWAADVEELADYLKLGRFAVLGFSSGGPHAMVAAALLGRERIASCGLVSSDAPYAQLGLVENVYGTKSVTLDWALTRAESNAVAMRKSYERMGKKDRSMLALADLAAATVQGFDGAAIDSVLEAGESWGFQIEDISPDTVLWHGTADADVPVEAGRAIVSRLPHCVASNFIEGENHTLIRRHWRHILETVIQAAHEEAKL